MLEAGGGAPKHKRGALFESVVLSAAAIAFGCVAFADFLNHAIKPGDQLAVAAAKTEPSSRAAHNGIDYSSTGTIIPLRQPPALNPCVKN